MSRPLIAAGLSALFLSHANAADVSVAGIRVTGPGYGKTDFGAELRPFNWSEGTSIALFISHPDGGLISVDGDKCTLTSIQDDTGKKLDEGENRFGQPAARFAMDNVSQDGKAAMIDVEAKAVPAKGATAIELKGKLQLLTGTTQESVKSKKFAFKKGNQVNAGDLSFEVIAAGPPRFGSGAYSITLRTKQPIDSVASWKFLKPDGSAVETRTGSVMRMGFNQSVTIDQELVLSQKIEEGILELDVWTDLKEVEVPIDLNVQLGL